MTLQELNTYDLLKRKTLVLTEAAVEVLEHRLGEPLKYVASI